MRCRNDAVKAQPDEIELHLKSLLGMRAEVRKDLETVAKIDAQDREMTLLRNTRLTSQLER